VPKNADSISSTVVDGLEDNPILKLFKGALTEQRALAWLFVSVSVIWICVLMLFVGVYILESRPVQIGKSLPTIREEVEKELGTVPVRRDHFDLFVISTCKILYNVDDSGASYRALLKGSVEPEILRRYDKETAENMAEIRAGMVVQNLTINTIRNFIYNPETGITTAYVMGYISTIIQQSEKGTRAGTTPFRAKVFVKEGLSNNLSPWGFYLVKIEERIGEAALDWDRSVL
jgi:hypothetical protein